MSLMTLRMTAYVLCWASLSQLMRSHPSERARLVHSWVEIYLSNHNVAWLITNLAGYMFGQIGKDSCW